MKRLAAAALCLSLTGPAAAVFKSGNDLYQDCTGDGVAQVRCKNFLVGAADSTDFWEILGVLQSPICIPNEVTAGQLQDVVLKYLNMYPEKRHLAAASLVINAFQEAFPC